MVFQNRVAISSFKLKNLKVSQILNFGYISLFLKLNAYKTRRYRAQTLICLKLMNLFAKSRIRAFCKKKLSHTHE